MWRWWKVSLPFRATRCFRSYEGMRRKAVTFPFHTSSFAIIMFARLSWPAALSKIMMLWLLHVAIPMRAYQLWLDCPHPGITMLMPWRRVCCDSRDHSRLYGTWNAKKATDSFTNVANLKSFFLETIGNFIESPKIFTTGNMRETSYKQRSHGGGDHSLLVTAASTAQNFEQLISVALLFTTLALTVGHWPHTFFLFNLIDERLHRLHPFLSIQGQDCDCGAYHPLLIEFSLK